MWSGAKFSQTATVRTQRADGFELERAEFERDGRGRVLLHHHFGERRAVVAAGRAAETGVGENARHQFGGGGLAVGAGDADDLSLIETGREFDFADDLAGVWRKTRRHRARRCRCPGLTTSRSEATSRALLLGGVRDGSPRPPACPRRPPARRRPTRRRSHPRAGRAAPRRGRCGPTPRMAMCFPVRVMVWFRRF